MKRLVETSKSSQSKKNRISPDQQNYLLHLKFGSNKSQRSGHQIAMRFRKVNVIRDGYSKLLSRQIELQDKNKECIECGHSTRFSFTLQKESINAEIANRRNYGTP